MKTLRILIPLLLLGTVVQAAAPKFYVTAQIGAYHADAGTQTTGLYILDRAIKSGTKSFSDLAVGAELLKWLAVEAGYVDLASFESANFMLNPDVRFIMAPTPSLPWQTYDLRGFRLTPVFTVYTTERVALKILGGMNRGTGRLVWRDRLRPGPESSQEIDQVSYHVGVGVSSNLSDHATIEARILRYEFGKPRYIPNRITVLTCSLGLSWGF